MNRSKQQGSLLIMTLLILFISLIFVTAIVWSVTCLNNLQKNENISIKENISVKSLVNNFDNISINGDKKANLRGPFNILINGEASTGSISFDYLHDNAHIRKYLILDAIIADSKGKAAVHQKAFKPVPTFTYSHFVINPNSNLGDSRVREDCYGVIRANNENNDFTNVGGTAIQDTGKPYIYMQNINIDEYINMANNYGLYLDTTNLSSDVTLLFYDNGPILVKPSNNWVNINQNAVMVIKNNGNKVKIAGINSNNGFYKAIEFPHNLTIITDSPIFIESDIYSNNSSIIISTFEDTDTITAFNMDINQYIQHKFMPDDVNIDVSSIYYRTNGDNSYNNVYLKSIFIAPNGSFGFIKNTYNGGPDYNTHIFNRYNVIGGVIEYNSNYDRKIFDDVPSSLTHISYIRDDSFYNIAPDGEFPFIAPPVAKNLFVFNSKYF